MQAKIITAQPSFKGKNLVGEKFGRLTVIRFAGRKMYGEERTRPFWICVCSCSPLVEIEILGSMLTRGQKTSCNCYRSERISQRAKTHGMKNTPEWKAWSSLKARCRDINNPSYPHYGGRGITFCSRWNNFSSFFLDVGFRPTPKHSLGRIDNNGNYQPGNVRWETLIQQANNKSTTIFLEMNGARKCIREWSEETGISTVAINNRLRAKWAHSKILTTPVAKRSPRK